MHLAVFRFAWREYGKCPQLLGTCASHYGRWSAVQRFTTGMFTVHFFRASASSNPLEKVEMKLLVYKITVAFTFPFNGFIRFYIYDRELSSLRCFASVVFRDI